MKYFLRCDWSICKSDWFYLIPTLKIFPHNKFLEIEIDILFLSIYWVFSIENYDNES